MIPTVIPISVPATPTTTARQAARIVAAATADIDTTIASQPFPVAILLCEWRARTAYRDLIELATHTERTVYVRPVTR